MSATCEICGREFKTTQGLRGHKTFVHQVTSSSGKSATPLATEQELSKLKDRLDKLEGITGSREESELEKLLGITKKPITAQLAQHTRELSELHKQVGELTKQVSRLTDLLNGLAR